jgi:uncharacterized membrane protein
MADYEQSGNPVVVAEDQGGSVAWCHVMYALHGISALGGVPGPATIVGSFLFGWPSIIAVILNYVTRGNVRNSWLETHWRWQLRTFWFAAAWALAGLVLVLTIIGIPLAWIMIFGVGVWVLYRVIHGWLALVDKRPMPVPQA